MSRRIERVNVLLRQEISRILTSELNDPRITSLVSVTRVDTSRDLGVARAYISLMSDSASKDETLTSLRSASGFVRRCLLRRVLLRTIPRIVFELDSTIQEGTDVQKLIDKFAKGVDDSEVP